MYSHLLTFDEELEFRMQRELRLMRVLVEPGMRVVVRIEARRGLYSQVFGMEYGGIVVFDERNEELLLAARRRFDTGMSHKVRHFPLNIGEDDLLYSTPLPSCEEHRLNVVGPRPQGVNWEYIPAQPARPSRPIGYVLDGSHARQEIRRPARFAATIQRSF